MPGKFDITFSISAAIGFIALSGVAVLDGIVMVSFIKQLREDGIELEKAIKEGALVDIQRVSKPGLRVYSNYRDMPRVLSGLGVSVLSTSRGILSSRKAKSLKIGGEIICNVW